MSKPQPFVTRLEDAPLESWSDARGHLSFHTLVSGDRTPSEGLVAGVAIVAPGGELAQHAHAQPEIYFALEGKALVTIDGVEHTVSTFFRLIDSRRFAIVLPAQRRSAQGAAISAAATRRFSPSSTL
jgi:hypothetical protein